jgi:DNA-binding NarL/FixJ family response regulator
MNCETAHIRVLIADDHPAMREGLRAIIDQQPDMIVVAEAGDGAEAVSACRTARPNVILMDLQMPRMDGVEAIDLIHRGDPNTPIVVLTTYSGDARVSRALAAGAMSYLLKMATGAEIVGAVRSASSGRRVFAKEVAHELAEHVGMERLTGRDIDVLKLVSRGNQNRRIGETLNVSEDTIKTRIKNILAKLQARDRTHAVSIARIRGFMDY